MLAIEKDHTKPLVAAGNRPVCARCTAKSQTIDGLCGRPAVQCGKGYRCDWHGALSTGPKTSEGRRRVAKANTVHGESTRAIRREQSLKRLELAHLEDLMYLTGLTTGPRSRGRKPAGYYPIRTFADAGKFLIDTRLNSDSTPPVGGN